MPTLNRSAPIATIGGEPGGRAPIVVEDKLGQDAVAAPEDDPTAAVPMGAAEPGRDVFAEDEQKKIKSQMIAPDTSVVEDEKEISVVKFEPTDGATEPAPASSENEGDSTGTRTNGTEDEGVPEAIENLEEMEAFGVGEDTDDSRMSHRPLDHEEAIADQVAYELYPDARDAE